jgi:hypothetical protein
MTFAAPIWLIGVLPWAAVVAYLVWGRRPRVDVPFLSLWPARGEGAVRVRRRATPPPVALALAILAMLLAVFAAGRPAVHTADAREPLTVIIDRGWGMSAAGVLPGRHPIFEEAGRLLGPRPPVEVWMVPESGGEPVRTKAPELSGNALRDLARPTALDTRDALRARIRERLGNTRGGLVVFSDLTDGAVRLDEVDGGRVVRVSPAPAPNTRIELLSVRESPVAQVMVRLRTSTGLGSGKLRLSSGAATAERDVALNAGGPVDVFIDLQALGSFVRAELLVNDDPPADNVAWLVREASWPRVEARMPLPASLQRMLDVYARQRPPGDGSRRVILARLVDEVPAGEAAVVLPPTGERATGPHRIDAPEVAEHPVTRNVNWPGVGDPPLAQTGPPAGWSPVVRAGGKVWVAVREQPIRAVWVGFDAGDWARSSDYVVFWANVLNWAGAGGERFAAHAAGSLEGDWTAMELAPSVAPPEPMLWPGLYRRSDGTLRAVRAPDAPDAAPAMTDWRERLSARGDGAADGVELAPWVALLSLLCLVGAAVLWKREEPRGFGSAAGKSGQPGAA